MHEIHWMKLKNSEKRYGHDHANVDAK
jgi:hypothetical protein